MSNSVKIQTERYTVEDSAVRVKLALPVLSTDSAAYAKRFAAYYGALSSGLAAYASGTLKKAAEKNGGAAYGAAINTVICHENGRVLSLYTDAAVTDADGSRFYRLPQLWDKESGCLIDARRLFDCKKRAITAALCDALEEKEQSGCEVYSDAPSILKSRFDIRRLYITPAGIVFFYNGTTLSRKKEPFPLPVGASTAKKLLKDGCAELFWEE